MSVREEDRQRNNNSNRGLGLAAAAIGVGVGAALYYFFSKRQEHPDSAGSTHEGWNCEHAQALFESMDSYDNTHETLSDSSSSNNNTSPQEVSSCTDSITSDDSDEPSELQSSNYDSNSDGSSSDECNSDENQNDDSHSSTSEEVYEEIYEEVIELTDDPMGEIAENESTETSSQSNINHIEIDDDESYNEDSNGNESNIVEIISDDNDDDDVEVIEISDAPEVHNVDSQSSESLSRPNSNFLGFTPLRIYNLISPLRNRSRITAEQEQLAKLRQQAFRERSWSLEECSICFDVILKNQDIMTLPCTHHFHTACLLPWLQEQQTCPNCRKAAE